MGMLKDLTQRPGKIAEILVLKGRGGLVAAEVERGE
jgi:hypothetical protein